MESIRGWLTFTFTFTFAFALLFFFLFGLLASFLFFALVTHVRGPGVGIFISISLRGPR